MKELVLSLILWITAHSGYAWDGTYPKITLVSQTEICKGYSKFPSDDCGVLAYYTNADGMVLNHAFDPTSLRDQATLLHELVHHLQKNYPEKFLCLAAYEPDAYYLEVSWLVKEHGYTVDEAWKFLHMDPFYVLAVFQCDGN